MYVEVLGRQTGKTSRLIDSVIEYLEENPKNTALIVTPYAVHRKEIQNKINEKCGEPCEFRTITSYKMLDRGFNSNMRQFVDEFWFLDEKNLFLDENAYYTTSPGSYENNKADEIYTFYKKINPIRFNKVLKKHQL